MKVSRRLRVTLALVGVATGMAAVPTGASADQAYALAAGNLLLSFDTNAPEDVTATPISGVPAEQSLRGIDVRPSTGQLYATAVDVGSVANSPLHTYAIDPATGAATPVGQVPGGPVPGAADVVGGYDFNPTVDRIRFVNVNDTNGRINPFTGTLAGLDTNLSPAGTTTIVGEAYDRNTPGGPPSSTTLYAINRFNSTLAVQGGINQSGPGGPNGGVVADFAPLGVTLAPGADAGFDVTSENRAYAALTASDGLTRLYDILLVDTPTTGTVAAELGPIGSGTTQIVSMTAVPKAPPKAARTLLFDAAKNKVKKGRKVGLSGQLDAPEDPACEAGVTLDLQRQKGEGEFATFAQVQTDAAGAFALKQKVKKTFTYRVLAGETDACLSVTSNTEKVKAKKP